MGLAEEYDSAHDRGEVAAQGQRNDLVDDHNKVKPTSADIGLRRDEIHAARKLRDAETESPGIVQRSIDAMVERGEEPTQAGGAGAGL